MNEITPELLAEFKDRMKLSDDEDQNLTRILKSSIEDLSYKCGPYDMAASETFKELVFERARYAYNDALEFFDVNFLKQITVLALAIPGSDGGGGSSEPGEPGAPGKSAYQIAVENGFNGTVTQWILSLKGEPGERGERGLQGIQGIPGERGLQGIQGIPGERGLQGIQGIPGERGPTGVAGPAGKDGTDANVTAANITSALGYTPAARDDISTHVNDEAPHRYGGKFEWRYNATTSSLDLVVLN